VDLQAAVAVYRLTEEAVATARTLHDLAQKQFTLGAVPFVHVTRTEIERQRIEQELVQAQAEVAAKQVALNVALGREPSVPVLPADDLAYQPVTVSLEALKALALQRRPEIVAAQSRLVARQFAVKSAQAQWLPDFLLLAHFGESERALRVTAPRLAVGIALPFLTSGAFMAKSEPLKPK
jgi:outer membrane protein TolC